MRTAVVVPALAAMPCVLRLVGELVAGRLAEPIVRRTAPPIPPLLLGTPAWPIACALNARGPGHRRDRRRPRLDRTDRIHVREVRVRFRPSGRRAAMLFDAA